MKLNLIEKLNSKSKPNFSKISEELDISRETLKKYFIDLERNKLIKNFTININPKMRPNLKYVILEIKTNPKEPQLVEELLKIRQLKMLDGIFGEYSLLALFMFKDSEEFNEVLDTIDKIMANSYFKKYQIIETIKIYKTHGIDLSKINLDPNFNPDNMDRLILKILQEEHELKLFSAFEISKTLNKNPDIEISQSTVYKRIRKLEETGIILNYSINFNPKKIGYRGKFIVRIKPKNPSKYNELALNLVKKKEITDLFRIGEQYGLFTIVRVKKIEDYGIFIKNLYDNEEIEDTWTNFILDERKKYTNFVLY